MNVFEPAPAERRSRPFVARGAILDLDGTLADTLEDLAAAVNHAVAPFGLGPYAQQIVRPMIGDGLTRLIERAAPDADDETRRLMAERFRDYYGEHFLDHTRLYPGWPGTLDRLSERRVPVAVLSNKPDTFTKAMVERLLARWRFVAVLGETGGLPLKPDPAGALTLCKQIGLPPDQVALVGDSPHDIETARRGGLRSIGVTWGFRPEDELRLAGADEIIREPDELVFLLSGS